MKIIGKTSSDHYLLVEMSKDELAKIIGKGHSASLERYDAEAGREHSVDERLSAVNSLLNIPETLKSLNSSVSDALKKIERAQATAEQTIFEKKK